MHVGMSTDKRFFKSRNHKESQLRYANKKSPPYYRGTQEHAKQKRVTKAAR